MAGQAPLHGERRDARGQRHLIDGAMTGGAADALGDVNAMVEIDKVRQLVQALPAQDFLAARCADQRAQGRLIRIELRMAGHTGGYGGNSGKRRLFHGRMTVAALDAGIAHVMLVTEGYRLFQCLANAGRIGGHRAPTQNRDDHRQYGAEQTQPDKKTETRMEQLCHFNLFEDE